jgi:hypothetical protein
MAYLSENLGVVVVVPDDIEFSASENSAENVEDA